MTTTKIYLDVLIITNTIVTLIYLQCISRVVRQKIDTAREIIACSVGGVGSLIAVVQTKSFSGALIVTIVKLAVISAIIIIAYLPQTAGAYFKRLFLYGMTELIFGGCCFMLVNFTHSEILYIRNYTVYFDISLPEIAVCCAFVYIIIVIYETVQRRRADSVKKYRATYTLGKYEITMPAIADTGNKLCDSFTGAPVIIFRSNELYEHYNLDRTEQMEFYGFRPAPYSTIGGDGIIFITSKGDVKISSEKFSKKVDCCIGVLPSGEKGQCAVFNPCVLI